MVRIEPGIGRHTVAVIRACQQRTTGQRGRRVYFTAAGRADAASTAKLCLCSTRAASDGRGAGNKERERNRRNRPKGGRNLDQLQVTHDGINARRLLTYYGPCLVFAVEAPGEREGEAWP